MTLVGSDDLKAAITEVELDLLALGLVLPRGGAAASANSRKHEQALPDFPQAARQYADVEIAAIPMGGENGKRPLVRNYQRFRVETSLTVSRRFPEANVGFCCGTRSGITVVDIDTTDGAELEWVLETFGPSPLIVGTGTGKRHVYYRNGGERRRIRPFPNHPIDILGQGGLVVAPPSIRPGVGRYEFIRGDLRDIRRLPAMQKPVALEALARTVTLHTSPPRGATISVGQRNNELFRVALRLAVDADTLDKLTSLVLLHDNERNSPPLGLEEAKIVACSAWRYKMEGQLWTPGPQRVVLPGAAVDELAGRGEVDALTLLARLQRAHSGHRDVFAASPEAMAKARIIGSWDKRRYREALGVLCRHGFLERIAQGGRRPGDPALYRFSAPPLARQGEQSAPQYNKHPAPCSSPP